jgi:hypothetical protein
VNTNLWLPARARLRISCARIPGGHYARVALMRMPGPAGSARPAAPERPFRRLQGRNPSGIPVPGYPLLLAATGVDHRHVVSAGFPAPQTWVGAGCPLLLVATGVTHRWPRLARWTSEIGLRVELCLRRHPSTISLPWQVEVRYGSKYDPT